MNHKKMEQQLILHEGLELTPYKDTEDNWTVGVGYNLTSRGIEQLQEGIGRQFPNQISRIILTRDEALRMLRIDITRIEKVVKLKLPRYDELSDVRQRVIIDMGFNMGNRALQFRKAIKHMNHEVLGKWRPNWSGVGREMFNSKWAYQVGDGPGGKMDRAERLVAMVLTDEDYVV